MSDRELVASILTYCKGEYSSTLNDFINDGYVEFNDQDHCIHLYLRYERLKEIPSELLELKHLKHLDLRFNSIKYIPKSLMASIDKVYIDDTVTIVDDSKPKKVKMTDRELVKSIIKQCKSGCLYTLNSFIKDEYVIFNKLGQCTHLNLSSERLTEIPKEIYKLKHLEYLNVSYSNIKTIPKSLYDSIDKIYIDDTVTIVDDSKPKKVKMTDRELVKSILTYCKGEYSSTLDNFNDNKYARFNDLDQCTHLYLSLEGLNYIPSELLELKHLKHLDLTSNNIKEIPKSLYDAIGIIYIDDTVTIIDDTKPKKVKMSDKKVELKIAKIYYNEGVKYKNESKLEIAIEYYENALSILLD